MSSTAGEIYVGETIRDVYREMLDDLFGQDKWLLLEASYRYVLNLDELPTHMVITVFDAISWEQGEPRHLATLLVENEFYVEDMGFHKQVAVRPINIQIREVQ